jgi:signal transduction histidine kinase
MEEQFILPATLLADSRQKQMALIVALFVPIPFIAILPIGQIQLPRVDSYIPVVDMAILINDSITATLLLAHFSITRAPSLLALAAGFLFTAFLIIPHALTLPGAFAPDGLLGAVLQTPAWLNEFWHLGLPSGVIAYALLKRADGAKPVPRGAIRFATGATVVGTSAIVWALLWLSTKGVDLLPPIMVDLYHSAAPWTFAAPVLLSITAMALLWPRRHLLLDLWLLVVLEIWMFDALLFYVLTTRYTLLWYGGRAFATFAASLVLVFLLSQTTVLYGRLARSHVMLERERENKLINVQAVIAAIAHEIRQPLGAITMNASAAQRWLERTPPGQSEAREALDEINNESLRVSEVFDGIRALFGKVDQERQPTDVNDIILSVIHSLEGQLNDHGVAVHRELAVELPLIAGHSGQLREVIFNLVNNSLEAMRSMANRSRVLHVRTELRDRDTIAVEIQDTGPGIDPNKLASIFGAFVTTKTHGTGLGLAICRMIVERHGGRLTVSSDGKNGALFQFVLPIEGAKT